MGCGWQGHCLVCKLEINEFTNTKNFMRCPHAHDSYDAISALLPQYATENRCIEVITMLQEGGYDVRGWRSIDKVKWSPNIPIIVKLATKLMRYEEVNGARFHESAIICKSCAEKLRQCTACGHDHDPACPICRAQLVFFS